MAKSDVLRARFGERVRDLLEENGLAIDELAERTGLPIERLQEIVQGRYARLALREMSAIAGAVAVPLFSLLAPLDRPGPVVTVEEEEQRRPRNA